MEYAQDLREYFAHGYGSEDISNRLGCGILKEMYQKLLRVVEGKWIVKHQSNKLVPYIFVICIPILFLRIHIRSKGSGHI